MPALIYKQQTLQCSHKCSFYQSETKIFFPLKFAVLFCKPTSAEISQNEYLKMLLWKNQSVQNCDKKTKAMRD